MGADASSETFSDPNLGWASSPVDDPQKELVFNAMAPVLMELAAELRRSIEYYRTKSQAPLEKIFITGGTAKIPNLDKFLTNELGLPVEVADPIGNVPVNSGKYSEQYLKEVSPLFTVSVGLAIRDML
jgi:type IV pilus assembly protein PilM